MIAIAIRFISGRFHATPWGRHVNEGVPEWPPSPWRILRALIACWQRTMPDIPKGRMERLLIALSSPPDFWLPPATLAHTRHFMPWFKKGPGDRTMVLDTFVAVDRTRPVLVLWPTVQLNDEDRALLSDLLTNLPYLGRSESWCRAELAGGGEANCLYLAPGREAPGDWEPVRVLVPEENISLADLLVETNDLRLRQKRIDPPGSRWVLYARPRNAFTPSLAPPREQQETIQPVAVRYALDAKPLPLLMDTIKIAEIARRSAMAKYGRANRGSASPTLSGKDADGQPRKEQHCHALYLPTDDDEDGRLDHLTIFAPEGFTREEREALARIEELNLGEGRPEIRLLLLGFATKDNMADLGLHFGSASIWHSVTPYVMSRHPKVYRRGEPKITERGYQKDGPEDQILREWNQRRTLESFLPELKTIEPLDAAITKGRRISWLDFRRWRNYGSAPHPVGGGQGYRLTFAGEVSGPIALGYGAHYGLGLFMPVKSVGVKNEYKTVGE